MKVLIWTDLEGVSGIVDFDKHEPLSEKDKYQRKLMTGELNAAVRACFDSGANKVKVVEGHDATDFPSLDPRALLVPARYPAIPKLQGWDGYEYMILIGAHSMAGTFDGVLAHTGNRNVIYRKVNGRTVGEIGTAIMQAGEFGIKGLMVSGDAAACREAKEFSPGITTAVVKKGYDMFHAECLHPEKARELIYNKVCEAFINKSQVDVIKADTPVVFEEKYKIKEPLEEKRDNEHMRIIDEYTVQYFGMNLCEAYERRCGL
jgi:D-amino peptidase